jgi:hypothetical protein
MVIWLTLAGIVAAELTIDWVMLYMNQGNGKRRRAKMKTRADHIVRQHWIRHG